MSLRFPAQGRHSDDGRGLTPVAYEGTSCGTYRRRAATMVRARLTAVLAAAAVWAPRVAGQACATVDTKVDESNIGLPADCAGVLALGYSCEDLACYAPSAPATNPQTCGVYNAMGYNGQCSLTCGQNTYDGVYGEGSCNHLIVTGGATCVSDFSVGQQYAGMCDFACGFCTASVTPDPVPSPPSTTCKTFDTLDSGSAPGACSAHLADGTLLCDHFEGGGLGAGQCSKACQLNVLEHPGSMSAEFQLQYADRMEPVYGATTATTAEEFLALMSQPLCKTLIEAFWANGVDVCTAFFLPAVALNGEGPCDFACNLCAVLPTALAPAWASPEMGSGCTSSVQATANEYDAAGSGGPGACAGLIAGGQWSCAVDFAPGAGSGNSATDGLGFCNLECGFADTTYYAVADSAACTAAGGAGYTVSTPGNSPCKDASGAPTGACCADPDGADAPQCASWIATFGGLSGADLACPNVFGPDRIRAGQCDRACGYCCQVPVDCDGAWGAWGDCDVSCGSGTQTRAFVVTTPALSGGAECSVADGTVDTNTQACTGAAGACVDCVGDWSDWGACDVTCGSGNQARAYTVTQAAENNGAVCPAANDATESRACDSVACVDCAGSWGDWGACSVGCGTGTQVRAYGVTTVAVGGSDCPVADGASENQQCQPVDAAGAAIACAHDVDCAGSWGVWGACDATCGSGNQARAYTVTQAAENNGAACPAANGDTGSQVCDSGVTCVTASDCGVGEEPNAATDACVPCATGTYGSYGVCSACAAPMVVSADRGSCAQGTTVVTGQVSFDGTMDDVNTDRNGFEQDFKSTMVAQFASASVTISASDITVTDIQPGSIVVSYSIDAPCGADCSAVTAANVAALASADAGTLASGSFSSMAPAPAPPPPAPPAPPPAPPPTPPAVNSGAVAPAPQEVSGAPAAAAACGSLLVLAAAAVGFV